MAANNDNNMCKDDDMSVEDSTQQQKEEEEEKQLKEKKLAAFEQLKKYAATKFKQFSEFWMEFIKTSCSEVGKNVKVCEVTNPNCPYKKHRAYFIIIMAIITRWKNAPLIEILKKIKPFLTSPDIFRVYANFRVSEDVGDNEKPSFKPYNCKLDLFHVAILNEREDLITCFLNYTKNMPNFRPWRRNCPRKTEEKPGLSATNIYLLAWEYSFSLKFLTKLIDLDLAFLVFPENTPKEIKNRKSQAKFTQLRTADGNNILHLAVTTRNNPFVLKIALGNGYVGLGYQKNNDKKKPIKLALAIGYLDYVRFETVFSLSSSQSDEDFYEYNEKVAWLNDLPVGSDLSAFDKQYADDCGLCLRYLKYFTHHFGYPFDINNDEFKILCDEYEQYLQ